jgi:hypothetical protein
MFIKLLFMRMKRQGAIDNGTIPSKVHKLKEPAISG